VSGGARDVIVTLAIDADDARAWGHEAFEMGLSLDEARRCIAECGCPAWLLPLVEEHYLRARSNAIHQEA
jgi:hypothetical protein